MKTKTATLARVSTAAFASAPKPVPAPGAPVAPAVPVAGTPAPVVSASKRRERADVKVLGIAAPMTLSASVVNSRRGKGSKYKFDDLGAPFVNPANPPEMLYHSFGLVGMDKKGFNSTLFSNNQRFKKSVPKLDAEGKAVTQTVDINDANGNKIGEKSEPVMVDLIEREFTAVEVDPAKDHEGASLRVFRTK